MLGEAMETRNEKFRRLSEARMTKVFSILNILRNQSDKSKYTFSKSDIEELFGALEQKGEEIKEFFTSPITIKTVNLKNSFHYSVVDTSNDKEVSFKKFLEGRGMLSTKSSKLFTKYPKDGVRSLVLDG